MRLERTARRFASAGEAAAIEERLFHARGRAAERRITVREAAEAADDVGVQLGPFQEIGIAQRADQRDGAFLIGKLFGMLERQIEEQPLRLRDALIEAARDGAVG